MLMNIRRGIATFTLDEGRCPKWLFDRMVRLSREMVRAIVLEYGPKEFIKRLSDPVWFQALGTVLAFDWNASGLTTILTAALKEAIRGYEKNLGIFICGGKGKTSRKTPEQIRDWGTKIGFDDNQTNALVYNSRMSAKVDSALVQDGFQIYHHAFFFTKDGAWTVIQQGMNERLLKARRYHWHSDENQKSKILPRARLAKSGKNQNDILKIKNKGYRKTEIGTIAPFPKDNFRVDPFVNPRESVLRSFVCEPHTGISSEAIVKNPLNLVAKESEKTRQISGDMVKNSIKILLGDIELLEKYATPYSQMFELGARRKDDEQFLKVANLENREFKWHPVVCEDFRNSKYLKKILQKAAEQKPEDYEKLLSLEGVGPKTMRALALVSEIIYGAKPSYRDPARYSFAHGGKDATPYPVDRETYDNTISVMKRVVQKTRLQPSEKQKAINKLDCLGK